MRCFFNQHLHFRDAAAPLCEASAAAGWAGVFGLDHAQPCPAQLAGFAAPLRRPLASRASVLSAVEGERGNGLVSLAASLVDQSLRLIPLHPRRVALGLQRHDASAHLLTGDLLLDVLLTPHIALGPQPLDLVGSVSL